MFVVGGSLDYAKVIHHSVTVEVKIGESGVGVVKECFELLHVLDCSEQCSHRFQIERLAYVLRVGRDGYRLVCPRTPADYSQKYQK